MVTARDISAYLDMLFPPSLSESWDNDGLSVDPCPFADVKTAAVALDLTSEVLDWAESIGAGCVVTHHPLIFRPLSSLRADDSVGKRVIRCIKSGIAAVSCHTRLDSAEGGVNDCLAAAAGLSGTAAFLPFGRVGDLPSPMPPAEFAALLERALCAPVAFSGTRPVSRVALVSGGGKDYVKEAFLTGADTYLTGEVNHSAAIDAAEYGINLFAATHHGTEAVVLPFIARKLSERFGELEVHIYGE